MAQRERQDTGVRPAIPPAVGAALWMVGALASFMLMAIGGREMSTGGFSTFQILFWRGFSGLVVISILLSHFGWHNAVTRQPVLQLGRNVVHFGGQFGWFFAISLLPLAQVFALEFTTPIWTVLLAALFLGERVTTVRLVAVALGFCGILLILRPGFETVAIAQLAALGAAFCYAASYVCTKKLTQTDPPLAIIFYMTVLQLPIGLAGSIDGWLWPDGLMWLWVAVVGVTALSAHYCIARALKLADAAIVVPMDFMRLPLSMLLGFLFYAELIDWWVLVGAAAILAGNFLNVRAENRRAP